MREKSEVLEKVGQNIKQARLLKKMTQDTLAEKIGKSTNFISLIERGESGVSLSTLVDICNVLHIDSSLLFRDLIVVGYTTEAENIMKSLIMFEQEDIAMVATLVRYIAESKE